MTGLPRRRDMAFLHKTLNLLKKARHRDIPGGLWMKCPACTELIYREEQEAANGVCPRCGHHFPLGRKARIALLADAGSFAEWDADLRPVDFLRFVGKESYREKLESNWKKTGETDAVTTGACTLEKRPIALGVMDFSFLGASMGSVVGERITRMMERAAAEKRPVVMVCASGGARMYEGMLSLMQMAKTSGAVGRLAEAKMPYITVLTHPTTAGVMASFAVLGDVILAEPGALIGFAGQRVIRETIQQELPKGFQTAEFLLEHGLLDAIVPRAELKSTLARILFALAGPVPA